MSLKHPTLFSQGNLEGHSRAEVFQLLCAPKSPVVLNKTQTLGPILGLLAGWEEVIGAIGDMGLVFPTRSR